MDKKIIFIGLIGILLISLSYLALSQPSDVPAVPPDQGQIDMNDPNWVNNPNADPSMIMNNFDKIDDLRSIQDPGKMQEAFSTKFTGKEIGNLGASTKIVGGLLQTLDPTGAVKSAIDPQKFPDGSFDVDKDGNVVFKPKEGKEGAKPTSMPSKGEYMVDAAGETFYVDGAVGQYEVKLPEGTIVTVKDGEIELGAGQKIFINNYEITNNDENSLPIRMVKDVPIEKDAKDLLKQDYFKPGISFYDKGMENGFAAVNVGKSEIITPTGNQINNIGDPTSYTIEYPFSSSTYIAYNPGVYNRGAEELQKKLNELGYKDSDGNRLSEDGFFGTSTKEALIQMQKELDSVGLLPAYGADGSLGGETANAMADVFGPTVTVDQGSLVMPTNRAMTLGDKVFGLPARSDNKGMRIEFTSNDKYYQYTTGIIREADQYSGTKSPESGVGGIPSRNVPLSVQAANSVARTSDGLSGSFTEAQLNPKLLDTHSNRLKYTREDFVKNNYYGVVASDAFGSGSSYINSPNGMRSDPRTSFHDGIDIATATGTKIYPMDIDQGTQPKVVQAGWNGDWGNQVVLEYSDGKQVVYNHLSEVDVKTGDVVSRDTALGKTGSTGQSTGPHLDLDAKVNGQYMDPVKFYNTYHQQTVLASAAK